MATLRYIKTKSANAAVDNLDVNIASDKNYIVKAVDFTAPAQANAGVKIYIGPTGAPDTLIMAGQSDKFVQIPFDFGSISGPKTLRIQLDNSANSSGALLGAVIYYEAIG